MLGTATSLTVIFVVAAVALYLLMRASLVAEFDAALAAEATALTSLVEQDKGDIEVEPAVANLPEFERPQRPHYFEIWAPDGKSVARSASLAGDHLSRPEMPINSRARFAPIPLPGGRTGRAVFLTFQARDESPSAEPNRPALTLAVARDTQDLAAALVRLGWLLAGVSVAAVFAGVATMAWVVRRGLRPLDLVAASIERVGVSDFSERIQPNGTPREVVPVVQRLNELLERLERVVARERSFTADVAHELRTPLAGLSSALEVSASRPRDPESYQDVTGKCLRVTRGMQSMVDNLLLLARADSRQLGRKLLPVEIGALLRECWDAYEAQARQRGLDVTWDVAPQTAGVHTDPDLLRMVVNNLSANAVVYCDAGGTVRISATTSDSRTELTVSNTATHFSPDDAAHVFDRFWRGDAARTDAGVRCGLGLSLCRKLVEVLGGTIAATSDDGTFRVTVVLPSGSPSPVHGGEG
jgi:heavy metal sensor kinase